MAQEPPTTGQVNTFSVMGILNVTPDSFYDGGRHAGVDAAVDHGRRMIADGADIIDVGGESTRPGSEGVTAEEELRRVVPVIEALAAASGVAISIDTSKAEVARRALDAGASWVNDISAGRFDPAMLPLAARRGCRIVLMHSRGTPRTMQQNPHYGDPVQEVCEELLAQVNAALAAGVARDRIILDPGIGFGKRLEDNLALLRRLDELVARGYPVLVGTSRKSFVGAVTGRPVEERLAGTLGSVAVAYAKGARIFRVHDVAATRDLLRVIAAIEGPPAQDAGGGGPSGPGTDEGGSHFPLSASERGQG